MIDRFWLLSSNGEGKKERWGNCGEMMMMLVGVQKISRSVLLLELCETLDLCTSVPWRVGGDKTKKRKGAEKESCLTNFGESGAILMQKNDAVDTPMGMEWVIDDNICDWSIVDSQWSRGDRIWPFLCEKKNFDDSGW